MKDLLIILLLMGLLWGGYQGLVFLGSFTQSENIESEFETIDQPLADNTEKRLNQSAIKEMKKKITPEADKVETPVIKEPEAITPPAEKTNGQKAMEAVRGTRLDIEGKPRSKADFYKESELEETPPYERIEPSTTTAKTASSANEADMKDQKVALAEKGRALANEFETKGNRSKKSQTKTAFNIEKGENENLAAPARPQEYEQPVKKFTPSKYVLVVGSYASADNAVKEVLRLKKEGYPKAGIVLSEKNLNLVSLGTFSDKETAKAQAAQIKKAGIDLFVKAMR